ncbi:hypothetical protein [Anaerorhabdus sp.]|uniref:hypothetical protein n=1 Tax=Anaerorhabdus sp. TaxID=1872524 RepID=UPI002FC845D1
MDKINYRRTELIEMGHAKSVVEQYCHCDETQAYKTKEPNGPFIIPYQHFMDWLSKNKKSN